MIVQAIHWVLMLAYFVLPAAAAVWAFVDRRMKRTRRPIWRYVMVWVAALVLSGGINAVYAAVSQARVRTSEVVIGAYFAAGMLLLVRAMDWLITRGLRRTFFLTPTPAEPTRGYRLRWNLVTLLRPFVLVALLLPYVMAAGMTYRPRVEIKSDPMMQLGFAFEPVGFKATDDEVISGWWIPAEPDLSARRIGRGKQKSDRTVLICHGLGANKGNQLVLARLLVPAGYNALAFDFRAHGDSQGHLTTFGDHERRDVLGAVQWLRRTHPEESKHIFGVGASMGGAALIAAASEPTPEGQAIEAIAVYGTYDSLKGLTRSVTHDHFLPPLDWLGLHLGLPMASAQVGTRLDQFEPAQLVQKLWPRPILVIHGEFDSVIDFEHGVRLFNLATQPKEHVWIQKGDHNDIVNDDRAAKVVREFFDLAHPVPAI